MNPSHVLHHWNDEPPAGLEPVGGFFTPARLIRASQFYLNPQPQFGGSIQDPPRGRHVLHRHAH